MLRKFSFSFSAHSHVHYTSHNTLVITAKTRSLTHTSNFHNSRKYVPKITIRNFSTEQKKNDEQSIKANNLKKEPIVATSPTTKKGFFQRWFNNDNIVAKPGFNRWLLVPGAVVTHLALGSIYIWSVINEPLTREIGVVTAAAGDWSLQSVVFVFSAVLGLHGISAALLGKWQERVGPRISGILGALAFGGGSILGGIGVYYHQLWLLYFGYGFLGGIGMGLSYVPPVACLIRWFPDRRGLATGLTIMGFGGGALVTTPISNYFLKYFHQPPTFLGKSEDLSLITESGKRFARVIGDKALPIDSTGGELKEVVVVTSVELKYSGFSNLAEGVYLAGTGSTGAAETLVALGVIFLTAMYVSAISFKIPPPGYLPVGWKPPPPTAGSSVSAQSYVHIDDVMRTPQFWRLWVTFGCVATAGLGVLSVAKTMMKEIFSSSLPTIVTTGFASSFVMILSVANLFGRLGWAALSDKIGRKNTFALFTLVSIPLYASIPYCVYEISASPSVVPLFIFTASTFFIVSFFGGIYAVCPPYESDLFGSKFVGAVHGRMLTASSIAAVAGPFSLTYLRGLSEVNAIKDLAAKLNPQVFYEKFGAPISELGTLINTKTVTIDKLLAVLPEGTMDPTPFLYNTSLYGAVGLVVVATIANFSIRPVHAKWFIRESLPAASNESNPSWMIAVDGTETTDHVFFWTVSSMKERNIKTLHVIYVDPPVGGKSAFDKPYIPVNDGDAHFVANNILNRYVAYGKQLGLETVPLLVTTTNVGEGIVATVALKKPENLIIGVKSKEASLGKFCEQNAKCKVSIVVDDIAVPEKEEWKKEFEKSHLQNNSHLHHVHNTSATLDGTPIVIYEQKPK